MQGSRKTRCRCWGSECRNDKHYNVRDHERFDIDHESPAHVELWQQWFQGHGIDPAEVLLTHWVIRRGEPDTDLENKIEWVEWGTRDGERILVHREVRLDRAPDPFPLP